MIKSKPILFTTDNTRGILEDRKIMTRRIIKIPKFEDIHIKQDDLNIKSKFKGISDIMWNEYLDTWQFNLDYEDTYGTHQNLKCPYEIGMHLWVKETWAAEYFTVDHTQKEDCILRYKADDYHIDIKWKPSIFMPREASRITLEVTDVGAEKIQDITPDDCIKEGINREWDGSHYWYENYLIENPFEGDMFKGRSGSKKSFRSLWDSIYAKPKPKFKNKIITHYESYPWSVETSDKRTEINGKPHFCYPNAWVWINSFKRIK